MCSPDALCVPERSQAGDVNIRCSGGLGVLGGCQGRGPIPFYLHDSTSAGHSHARRGGSRHLPGVERRRNAESRVACSTSEGRGDTSEINAEARDRARNASFHQNHAAETRGASQVPRAGAAAKPAPATLNLTRAGPVVSRPNYPLT